ncbi:MAG: SGNH/GDSL hydrolase family protein [Verrucomicrobiia bacterium]
MNIFLRIWCAVVCAFTVAIAAGEPSLPKTGRLLTQGAEPVRIVCFGDSITGVYYHTGGRRAWCDMLGIALQRLYPNARLQMINAGVSGNTTAAGLARIERDVLAHKPHLVVVMFGMNDMAFDAKDMAGQQIAERETRFAANLREIIRRCRDVGAEVVLCTQNSIYPDAVPRRPPERLARYAEVIRAVAADTRVPLADCYRAYESLRAADPRGWMLLMSETIHPNMNGHKLFAGEIARVISGKRVSLRDVMPLQPCIPRTLALLREGKPINVIAMESYHTMVPQVLKRLSPNCEIRATCWPTVGKTLAQLESWGKSVRAMKPDLVVIAVPTKVSAPAGDEALIRSYSWIVNYSMAFGRPEWDVVAILPPGQDIARDIILGHDVACIEHQSGNAALTEDLLSRWFRAQRSEH